MKYPESYWTIVNYLCNEKDKLLTQDRVTTADLTRFLQETSVEILGFKETNQETPNIDELYAEVMSIHSTYTQRIKRRIKQPLLRGKSLAENQKPGQKQTYRKIKKS